MRAAASAALMPTSHHPSHSYLVADFGTRCDAGSAEYALLSGYAKVAALVYSLGIPTLYLALLSRHWRRGGVSSALEPRSGSDVVDLYRRDGREEIAHLSFLFGAYKPAFWWFEVHRRRARCCPPSSL